MNSRKRRILQLWFALLLILSVMSFGMVRFVATNSPNYLQAVISTGGSGGPGRGLTNGPPAAATSAPAMLSLRSAMGSGGNYASGPQDAKAPPLPPLRKYAEAQAQATVVPPGDLPVTEIPTPGEPLATTVVPVIAANPFVDTGQDRLSTFALDVDTGSYTAARNYITGGVLPPTSNVRPEEFINYFRYDYPVPESSAFGIYVDSAPSPYGTASTQYVRVGIQGQRVSDVQRQDAVLTFVIDISGSMSEQNRLPLVKQALRLLVNELRPSDQVGIVVYGEEARTVLDHTGVADKDAILNAIDSLQNEGSTNAEAGLRLGYELASQHLKAGAINRVILCSDGVANVGAITPDGIRQSIRDFTKQGILLTTVGFGMGDYNDYLMEQLADDGDGSYAYVDTLASARRIFVENLTGTLQLIAKDAKVQVDFNPAVVSRYRLVGYENRDVADNDFRNDAVDAGEIGAGHTVTALYEVELVQAQFDPSDEAVRNALTVQMRYADPKTGAVTELTQPFERTAFGQSFAASKARFQLAVAAAGFAEQLRGSEFASSQSPDDVLRIAQRIAPQLSRDADVQEFLQLVTQAGELQKKYKP